jgi:hypothetical protein
MTTSRYPFVARIVRASPTVATRAGSAHTATAPSAPRSPTPPAARAPSTSRSRPRPPPQSVPNPAARRRRDRAPGQPCGRFGHSISLGARRQNYIDRRPRGRSHFALNDPPTERRRRHARDGARHSRCRWRRRRGPHCAARAWWMPRRSARIGAGSLPGEEQRAVAARTAGHAVGRQALPQVLGGDVRPGFAAGSSQPSCSSSPARW